jgi:hypothetical protein
VKISDAKLGRNFCADHDRREKPLVGGEGRTIASPEICLLDPVVRSLLEAFRLSTLICLNFWNQMLITNEDNRDWKVGSFACQICFDQSLYCPYLISSLVPRRVHGHILVLIPLCVAHTLWSHSLRPCKSGLVACSRACQRSTTVRCSWSPQRSVPAHQEMCRSYGEPCRYRLPWCSWLCVVGGPLVLVVETRHLHRIRLDDRKRELRRRLPLLRWHHVPC